MWVDRACHVFRAGVESSVTVTSTREQIEGVNIGMLTAGSGRLPDHYTQTAHIRVFPSATLTLPLAWLPPAPCLI